MGKKAKQESVYPLSQVFHSCRAFIKMLLSEESRGFSGLEYSDFVSKGQSAKSSNPLVKSRGGGKALLSIREQHSGPPLRELSFSTVSARREFFLIYFKMNTTVQALFREQMPNIAFTYPLLQEKWIGPDQTCGCNTRPPIHSPPIHPYIHWSIHIPIHLYTPSHPYSLKPLSTQPIYASFLHSPI